MKLKPLLFAVLVLAVLSAAVFVRKNKSGRSAGDPRVGQSIAGNAALDQAQIIRVRGEGKTITLVRQPDRSWIDQDYHGLPADFDKVSSLVNMLTGVRITRFVTANPERFKHMEFADGLEFLAAPGQPLLAVTFGKTDTTGGRFFHYDNDPRAYVTKQEVYFDTGAKIWADSRLLSLKASEIAKVEVMFPGGISVSAEHSLPAEPFSAAYNPGRYLRNDQIQVLLNLMAPLRFSDTRELSDPEVIAARQHLRTLVFEQFDGTRLTVAFGRRPGSTPAMPAGAGAKAAPAQVPPGPVIAFITSSKAGAPINALMQKRAFEVSPYIFITMLESPDRYYSGGSPPVAPPAAAPGN